MKVSASPGGLIVLWIICPRVDAVLFRFKFSYSIIKERSVSYLLDLPFYLVTKLRRLYFFSTLVLWSTPIS